MTINAHWLTPALLDTQGTSAKQTVYSDTVPVLSRGMFVSLKLMSLSCFELRLPSKPTSSHQDLGAPTIGNYILACMNNIYIIYYAP